MIDVSVLVVFRDEEDYIIECIRSIEEQFEHNELNWELILVDGDSRDSSTERAQDYLKHKDYPYQILHNPKKTLATGWNLGIKAAQGSYVVRPDAHAKLHNGYIEKGIANLKAKEEVTAVGGVLDTKAKGYWGNIIKVALSSRVGVGNSGFRTATQSGFSDTAVYAVYRKEIFEKVGYFNEDLVRHQDNDMHQRIKKAGGKFYMNVEMKADYYARDSVKKLLRQMYLIGYYLPDVMGDGAVGMRHLAPFGFYLILVIGLLLSLLHPLFAYLTALQMGLYFLVIAMDSLVKVFQQKKPSLLLNIFIIPAMHLFYAFGTGNGLIRKILKK
jgi:glycosyltransferase involved in cell wall biosynthesis